MPKRIRKSCSRRVFFPAIIIISLVATLAEAKNSATNSNGVKPPYDTAPFPPENLSVDSKADYQLVRRLGTGKFSDVFEAINVKRYRGKLGDQENPKNSISNNNNNEDQTSDDSPVVLKVLKPVSDRKIRREVWILQHVSCLPHLVRLLGLILPKEYRAEHRTPTQLPKMPSLVLEHAGQHAQWLCHPRSTTIGANAVIEKDEKPPDSSDDDEAFFLSDYEIRYHLCHLLMALESLHELGIMHRDVKPRNVLINRSSGRRQGSTGLRPKPLVLIDLGLADVYVPNTRYNVRVASRHYKSPELLVSMEYYGTGLDLWGVGCILVGLLLRQEPLFRGKDNVDQLGQIIQYLGTEDLEAYLNKYSIPMNADIQGLLETYRDTNAKRVSSWELVGEERSKSQSTTNTKTHIIPEDGLDLVNKLLVYDHKERWNAKQALDHPFFDSVRDVVRQDVENLRSRDLRSFMA